jgi:hypothetical protein
MNVWRLEGTPPPPRSFPPRSFGLSVNEDFMVLRSIFWVTAVAAMVILGIGLANLALP